MADPRALVVRVVFPLPPIALKVNRVTQHWGALHRTKADYRTACGMAARSQYSRLVTMPTCHMTVTAYLGKRQRCDPSDLGSWCKVPIDVLVRAGYLASDSAACIKSFTAIVERDASNPRLEIVLKEETP